MDSCERSGDALRNQADSVVVMERAASGVIRLQSALVMGLLIACTAAALAGGSAPVAQLLVVALFAGWFALGIVRIGGRVAGSDPAGGAAAIWLLGLTASWLWLVAVAPANVWLAFSLWLLAGLVLSLTWSVVYAAMTLVIVLAVPGMASEALSIGEFMGPVIGAVCAIAIARGYRRLVRETVERQALIDSLVRAQSESDALHAQLSELQRVAGVMAERARLSRDIHDTLAQSFASILFTARRAGALTDDGQLSGLLMQMKQSASSGLDDARRVVANLAPSNLTDSGLVAALRRIGAQMEDECGLATSVYVEGDMAGLPTHVEVALLRTAQGALANVRQHAEATRIGISLVEDEGILRMDIVDDGIGFEPHATSSEVEGNSGYGLRSIRSRLRELGGDLEIESSRQTGTAITAVVPISVRA